MEIKEITSHWLGLPSLEKYKEIGEQVVSDIKSLKRLEALRQEIKKQRAKK